jgi:glycosyltransferase involved in cell wall biosynthesis
MKTTYDYIIVTNVPAFYKLKLYNELAKFLKLKIIFCSGSSSIREGDFFQGDLDFEHEFLFVDNYESRNKFSSLFKLTKLLFKHEFNVVLFPSWELLEFIPLMLLLPKNKVGIVIESSIIETNTTGYHWLIKKIIINSVGYAFPSGKLQLDILLKANYKGLVRITHGVGLPRRNQNELNFDRKREDGFKYLYVGRISQEKNIEYLIDMFNRNKKSLTIVGDGPLLKPLVKKSEPNIKFTGYINNENLPSIYKEHDIFILPSISEPWGLVIDEALWFGLPVVVSENVGCLKDLVIDTCSGTTFSICDDNSFERALTVIESNYDFFASNVKLIDFNKRDNDQISAYLLYENTN